ncbi:hypothetical protein HUE56_09795 [Azospirillum oryzae]|uniref:Uncharacterized protein n=1 Tax=Azospirillum oryzae TaxID=286727 RepID=A0A6N1AH13_9PROT|nr:hypothetical protein [Azospirillum oryzae]KAA0585953.1 hypothetical protein FZ938_22715 [Azospirillum oryzae]QKS50830.1 hypothetical protein HUE56_09795 [Azospirillum oryzae]
MPIRTAVTLALVAAVGLGIGFLGIGFGSAAAQTAMPMDHAAHHAAHHTDAPASPSGVVPTMPGQDAFGTIQEIVRILETDPGTDWSRVDIEALRRHLVDMNEVTLNATAVATPVDGGASYTVTGDGRTLEAIRRMVPAHAHEIDGVNGWTVKAEPVATGVVLTVTATDPKQTAHIRGLGFIGIMAQGGHHQMHHLAMARGEFSH